MKNLARFPEYLGGELRRVFRGRNPWERGPLAPFFDRIASSFEFVFRSVWETLLIHQRALGWTFALVLLAGTVIASLWLTIGVLASPPRQTVALSKSPPIPSAPYESGEALLHEVSELLQREEYAEVPEKIEKLRSLLPNDARTWQMAGAALVARQDFPGARLAFDRSVELNPREEIHRFNRAEVEFMAGNFPEAVRLFRQMQTQFPLAEKVGFRLYLCAILQGDRVAATALLDSLPAVNVSPEAGYIRAAKALHDGDTARANQLIQTAHALYHEQVKDYDLTLRQTGLLTDPPKDSRTTQK